MKVHWFQHVPFERLGFIGEVLAEWNAEVEVTRWHQGEREPSLEGVDLLIVMGGPMRVGDTSRHPWLAEEGALIGEAIAAGVRVLGVCLGAQLIAHCGDELDGSQFVQSPDRMLEDGTPFARSNALMRKVLARLMDGAL